MVRLPERGVVVVGRAPGVDLQLGDSSVSRRHAEVALSDGVARLRDAGSHNGVWVNGERIVGEHTLNNGDVIGVGAVTLVYHRPLRPPRRRDLASLHEFRDSLEIEIERSLRHQRPLVVMTIEVEGAASTAVAAALLEHLRGPDILAVDDAGRLVASLPELAPDSAAAVGRRLLAALAPLRTRAGYACCPNDACDVDTLLSTARDATRSARWGEVASLAVAVRVIALGDQTILVADPATAQLFALLHRLASSEMPVLINGETGVGKESAARAIHDWSPRCRGPFIVINCAALQETLVESELFGYERGAFSGAETSKAGRLEVGSGGTVFLDEVGELSPAAQAKLLRAIEARRVSRLGSVREHEIDIRVVAATNRDLREEVQRGRFRQDLFFRLGGAMVIVPPLRQRPRDLPVLARSFLDASCARLGRRPLRLPGPVMSRLSAHEWPGNVRELRNLMDYLAATVAGDEVRLNDLPAAVAEPRPPAALPGEGAHVAVRDEAESGFRNLYDEVRELERARIAEALAVAGGVRARAARLLGMPLRTFATKLREYEIVAPPANRGRPPRSTG